MTVSVCGSTIAKAKKKNLNLFGFLDHQNTYVDTSIMSFGDFLTQMWHILWFSVMAAIKRFPWQPKHFSLNLFGFLDHQNIYVEP